MNRLNLWIGAVWLIIVLGLPRKLAGQNDFISGKEISVMIKDLQVVHPQFRQWPEPSAGMEPSHNAPFLLWPVSNHPGVSYDVRLSRDSGFNKTEYTAENIPYGIYSPYEVLDTGTWYWQYRTDNGAWSKTSTFPITASTPTWNLPSKDVFKNSIPVEHPRVLMRKADLTSFRIETAQNEEVMVIIKDAEKKLKMPFIQEKLTLAETKKMSESQIKKMEKDASKVLGDNALGITKALCQAYILTGNETYASRAIEWAVYVASWDPYGVSSISDFGDARSMLSMALVYDTFDELLSNSVRADLLRAIHVRADRFYKSWINEIEAKVLSNHVWQHNFHYFFQTSLATYGDIPDAGKWLDYLYELFLARAPALGRDDGAWVNGNSYFTMNMDVLLDVPIIIKELTGFDFIRHKKWYQNNPYYLWYSFPPHSSSDGFGDNSERFTQPNKQYIAYADALARLTGNPLPAEYARKVMENTNITIEDDRSLRWMRLRYLRKMPLPEDQNMGKLQRTRIFPDAGLVYMHSDLRNTSRNLMFAMRSSPFGSYGHMLADQNTFNILYAGQPLFFHSGHKISMNDPHRLKWYKHTKSHNGILIDGHGQPYSTEAFGWIPRLIEGEYMSYVVGDASHAYNSVDHGGQFDYGLDRFERHVAMLYPDIIVIYDMLQAGHPAEWTWTIHSPQEIDLQDERDEFFCSMGKVSSLVNIYGSSPITWNLTDEYEVKAKNWRRNKTNDSNNEYDDSGWHLQGVSDPMENMRFLSIIQVKPDGQLLQTEVNEDGQITCGDWMIRAELDEKKPSELKITRKDGKAAFISSGDQIRLGDQSYKGRRTESAKLVEVIDGQVVFQESEDQMPAAMKLAAKQFNNK